MPARKIMINPVEDAATQRALRGLQEQIDNFSGGVGAAGPAGADGADGAPGPAPSGTGFVKVTGGVLDVPSPEIAQAEVTDLVADLAAKAETGSNVGGEAEVFKDKVGVDLRFRTLKAGVNITITENADDVEIASADLTGIGLGLFGSGVDGTADFDGVATVAGIAPATSNNYSGISTPMLFYALVRDVHFTSITIRSGVTLYTSGYRLFVNGTLVGEPGSFIAHAGADGTTGGITFGGAGGGASNVGTVANGAAGGTGAAAANSAAVGGGASASGTAGFSNSGGAAGGTGANGQAGVVGKGGGGGGNPIAGAGSPAGTVTLVAATAGSVDNVQQAVSPFLLTSSTRFSGGSGGGGGRGSWTGNGAGGGGGAGGGVCVVCAREITGSVTCSVRGGRGGNGYQGAVNPGDGTAGGGGGGGGLLSIVIGTGSFPATDISGGVGGLNNPAGGGDGGDGGVGLLKQFRIGA